jgi:hypothetical protein
VEFSFFSLESEEKYCIEVKRSIALRSQMQIFKDLDVEVEINSA